MVNIDDFINFLHHKVEKLKHNSYINEEICKRLDEGVRHDFDEPEIFEDICKLFLSSIHNTEIVDDFEKFKANKK